MAICLPLLVRFMAPFYIFMILISIVLLLLSVPFFYSSPSGSPIMQILFLFSLCPVILRGCLTLKNFYSAFPLIGNSNVLSSRLLILGFLFVCLYAEYRLQPVLPGNVTRAYGSCMTHSTPLHTVTLKQKAQPMVSPICRAKLVT